MSERPIIFSAPMVRAILDGSKTQTRRVVKGATGAWWDHGAYEPRLCTDGNYYFYLRATGEMAEYSPVVKCPYGGVGDRLWVRESFAVLETYGTEHGGWPYETDLVTCKLPSEKPRLAKDSLDKTGWWIQYRAEDDDGDMPWRSPLHMPRWASRITLEILAVRAMRVQEITEEDAVAEGCRGNHWLMDGGNIGEETPAEEYERVWDSINAKRGFPFASNPWVWALTFRVLP